MNEQVNIITSAQPRVWFTSDLHFGHKKAHSFMPAFRDENVDIMDNMLIEMWNSVVNKRDIVYNLGDLSFYYELEPTLEIIKQLNGHHFLILGNHDGLIRKNSEKLLNMKKDDGLSMFEHISHYHKIKTNAYHNKKVRAILSHYPMFEWEDCQYGNYMLHGHLHDYIPELEGRILNVGFDLHGKMLSVEDVFDFLEDIPVKGHHNNIDSKLIKETNSVIERKKLIKEALYHNNKNNMALLKERV